MRGYKHHAALSSLCELFVGATSGAKKAKGKGRGKGGRPKKEQDDSWVEFIFPTECRDDQYAMKRAKARQKKQKLKDQHKLEKGQMFCRGYNSQWDVSCFDAGG